MFQLSNMYKYTNSLSNDKRYLQFCRIFHNSNLPKLKFKELSESYKLIYRNQYGIDEKDINKASFILFLISFISIFCSLFLILKISILFIILISFVSSLFLSYMFNIKLFKQVNKKEIEINALLYLVKIYYNLMQKALEINSDFAVIFIKLIKDYNLPVSENFKEIIKKIQEGETPERELNKIITPSEDFNTYLKELLICNFDYQQGINSIDENSLEKRFKIFLKQIESKLSIIFFIGIFYPLGLSFLILFQRINIIFIIILLPVFLFILKILFRKFLKTDHYLIGLLNEYSKIERKRYDEFLLFLKGFAMNLERRLSPETSFLNSYSQNKTHMVILSIPFQTEISKLLNFNCSFEEMLDSLKFQLKTLKYGIILDIINRIIKQSAYDSSSKIFQIIEIINKHKKLESKLEIIIKGEKFKVFLFLFLLPTVIGAIGGMFPFFILLIENINLDLFIPQNFFNLILTKDVFILFGSLLFCNTLTSFYFLKIIRIENRSLIIFLIDFIYVLIFFLSFFNVLSFF